MKELPDVLSGSPVFLFVYLCMVEGGRSIYEKAV